MNKRKIYRALTVAIATGIAIAVGAGYYLYNKPHRDVGSEEADFHLTAGDLVQEYLSDPDKADKKYLYASGELRVLAVTGVVHSVTRDMNDQVVLLLKQGDQKAGVNCTFTKEASEAAAGLVSGETVTVKGVIRSGAGYDEFLEIHEDVILQECSLLEKS